MLMETATEYLPLLVKFKGIIEITNNILSELRFCTVGSPNAQHHSDYGLNPLH